MKYILVHRITIPHGVSHLTQHNSDFLVPNLFEFLLNVFLNLLGIFGISERMVDFRGEGYQIYDRTITLHLY